VRRPIREPGVRQGRGRRRDRGLNGVPRRRLRQRRRRDVLRHPQERARQPPHLALAAQLQSAGFEYIEAFYNRQRRHSTLHMLSPANYEQLQLSPLGG
ncbi:MAG: IS3 family transposase, partial [Solirubrobacterales bacterium]|nr:IS3 family transposase [Solirubrobacterales bacterium]